MSIKGLAPVPRHKTLAEDTYDRLRSAIMTGAVRPGEKISARSVADSAQVSFTPAREAIGRLISEGALELVGPKTIIVPQLSLQSLSEIYKIRINVEVMAAEIATPNMTRSLIFKLEETQDELETLRKLDSYQASLELNEQFHFLIYKACNMPRLIAIIESLWLQVGPSFNFLLTPDSLPEDPIGYHRTMIEGLKNNNPKQVSDAICADLEFGFQRLKDLIQSME
ncbi:GntR family transcriptional regulator [Lentilitoribacter sp. EG35]|jgi:DNA-binding GntR family transcriptional regulator|uniref:GntR family transcriptional regulator n=1 Tax=Lentilitoribacter sp. EG35 TaxID=3234192 RepID=UPI0034601E56